LPSKTEGLLLQEGDLLVVGPDVLGSGHAARREERRLPGAVEDEIGLELESRVEAEPHFVMVYPKVVPLQGYELASRRARVA